MDNKELRATAQKIAKEAGVQVVYLNSKEEWFTSSNRAELSDKKENIQTFDFTKEASEEVGSAGSDDTKAVEAKAAVLKKIANGKKKENIEALIAGFEEDEEVKKAIADKVASLA